MLDKHREHNVDITDYEKIRVNGRNIQTHGGDMAMLEKVQTLNERIYSYVKLRKVTRRQPDTGKSQN